MKLYRAIFYSVLIFGMASSLSLYAASGGGGSGGSSGSSSTSSGGGSGANKNMGSSGAPSEPKSTLLKRDDGCEAGYSFNDDTGECEKEDD